MDVEPDRRLRVPAALAPWVDDVRLSTAPAGGPPTIRVPDAATRLVFRHDTDGRPELLVLGPQTRASYLATTAPGQQCISLRLRPGRSAALLDVPPADLIDRTAPLDAYWGSAAPALAARIAGDPGDIVAGLAEALLARLPGAVRLARSELTVSAVRGMADGDRLTVVARRVGVSERQLRNLFQAEVGVSPKHFARIDRLRRALDVAGQRGWAEVARDAGYYDQAHLSADFVSMMGVPPGAFLAGRLPSPGRCGAPAGSR